MRTLNQYLGRAFGVSFLLTVAVLTFVMSLVSLFRITDLLARGVPAGLIAQFFLWSMPALLVFTIPVSVLTATLLVYGRLSHNGELTAMRACGISLWQTARRPIFGACLMTAVCLGANFELAPRIDRLQRAFRATIRSDVAINLLEEGQFVPVSPGVSVYIWRKKGDQLKRVVIADRTEGFLRRIEAAEGTLRTPPDGASIELDLRDVRITPFIDGDSAGGFCERWPVRIPIDTRDANPEWPPSSLRLPELINALADRHPESGTAPDAREHLRLVVEIQMRLVLSVACLAFVLLGIPLGIRNPRRESSVSVGISLLLAFTYYLFIIAAQTLSRRPELSPHLFVWLPVPVSVMVGLVLIRRSN